MELLLNIAVTGAGVVIGTLIALALLKGGKADDDNWPGGMA